MKHYFKSSMHIVIGLLVIVVALVLWRGSARAPQDLHDVPPMAKSPKDANLELMKNSNATPITSEVVEYAPGTRGFYARPKALGAYPGIVMIHEWWGLNDYMRDTAKELAGQGYQVLAVDLFGTTATTSDAARKQVASLDQMRAKQNMRTAVAYLRAHGDPKIASLGWCFGGGQSLQLAISGEQLNATIMYYGNPVITADQLRMIKWPLLGLFAGDDASIPPKLVNEFKDKLNELGIENSITIYPGVKHAFANPSGPSYAPKETKDAWEKTLQFLKENLQ